MLNFNLFSGNVNFIRLHGRNISLISERKLRLQEFALQTVKRSLREMPVPCDTLITDII